MSPDENTDETAENELESELTSYWKEGTLEEKLNDRSFKVLLRIRYPHVTEEKIRTFYGLGPKK
ncbi:MAG: hypothetical protein KGS09_21235 [Nitrospirae bacterium]|nr:hypothetical protein [Nitrospirota bacterium]MDE3043174.1 hypothetical protein [Nitrospirota bacterium]MDE3221451.1 hypothetical protein [Nitrospirota bacterium]